MGGESGKVSPEPQGAAGPGEERAGGAPGSWSGGMGIGGSSAEPGSGPAERAGSLGRRCESLQMSGLALSLRGAEVTETP